MKHTARDYQARADAAIDAAYASGKRAALAVSPTGSGKTWIGLSVRSRQPGPHLWIAPSNDLVRQVVERLTREGAACSWFSSDGKMHGRIDDPASLHVTTVQRLAAAHRSGRPLPRAAFVVFDEARSMTAREWGEVAAVYRSARILGLDATPMRSDGSGLGGLFDCLIEVASVRELIDAGYLAPFRVLAPGKSQPELAAEPVDAWHRLTPGQSAMCFCATVQHALDTCAAFRAAGVVAESIDQSTSAGERSRILGGLGAGSVQVVTNALILRQGIDVPEVSAVVLARPFQSLSAYLQAIGRGARPGEGKVCTVLDLMGAVHTHGLPDAPRTWHLDGAAVRLLDALPPCVMCRACLSWGTGGTCQICGAALPPPPPPRVKAADLIEQRAATDSTEQQQERLSRFVRDAYKPARDKADAEAAELLAIAAQARVARSLPAEVRAQAMAAADNSAWRGAHRWKGTYGTMPARGDVLAAIKQARETYAPPPAVRPPAEPSGAQLSLV